MPWPLKRKYWEDLGFHIYVYTTKHHTVSLFILEFSIQILVILPVHETIIKTITRYQMVMVKDSKKKYILKSVDRVGLNSTCLTIIPEDVFVPAFVQCILFSNEVIVFPTQKRLNSDVQLFSFRLAVCQRLLHDTWSWYTISSPLLFLSPFLAVTEASHSNATMMVISLCLSKRVST